MPQRRDSENMPLVGTILGIRQAQVEDLVEPSELLEARVMLALADAWTRDLPVAPETRGRARKVFHAVNECFEQLFKLPLQP